MPFDRLFGKKDDEDDMDMPNPTPNTSPKPLDKSGPTDYEKANSGEVSNPQLGYLQQPTIDPIDLVGGAIASKVAPYAARGLISAGEAMAPTAERLLADQAGEFRIPLSGPSKPIFTTMEAKEAQSTPGMFQRLKNTADINTPGLTLEEQKAAMRQNQIKENLVNRAKASALKKKSQ